MHPQYSKLNVIDMNNLHFVICGAALTIQRAWRQYKRKNHQISHLSSKTFIRPPLKTSSLISEERQPAEIPAWKPYSNANFQCDVEILVEKLRLFSCHSVVLSHSIGYFKDKFVTVSTEKKRSHHKYKFKMPQSITIRCWQVIQNFIYGHDVEIDDMCLYNELINAAHKLDIPSLLSQLKIERFKVNNLNTNNNNNNENVAKEMSLPLQLMSNYYKFFKCVLSSYLKRKLSLQQTHYYLSSKFINYEKMSEHELRKCIYLVKTKFRTSNNTSLVSDLIKIFLKN